MLVCSDPVIAVDTGEMINNFTVPHDMTAKH